MALVTYVAADGFSYVNVSPQLPLPVTIAQTGVGATDMGFVSSGATDLTSALGLAALPVGAAVAIPVGATSVTIRAEIADVRWRSDGSAPAAGVGGGNLLKNGEQMTFGGTLKSIQFINDVAASGAIISFNYWK